VVDSFGLGRGHGSRHLVVTIAARRVGADCLHHAGIFILMTIVMALVCLLQGNVFRMLSL